LCREGAVGHAEVPALQPGVLDYIAGMRKLRNCFLATVTVVLLALTVYLTYTVSHWLGRGGGPHLWDTTSVVHEVQNLADLVTVKYVIEKVVVLEDVKWYGESRVLLLAHGIVKAGVDLKRLQPGDITIADNTISIRLPLPQITDAYLDDKETKVIDHTTGLLRAFDKDLEQTARQNAVDDIARAARRGGILTDADQRAREELTNLLKRIGFEHVEFR
jgi:hypothetical protein